MGFFIQEKIVFTEWYLLLILSHGCSTSQSESHTPVCIQENELWPIVIYLCVTCIGNDIFKI